MDLAFEDDNKNYHLWSYRIWLCQKFNLYKEEWALIDGYINKDVYNNSAWNYRFFLFVHLQDENLTVGQEI